VELIVTSILAFVSTNLDDLFILTLFFGDKKNETSKIYFGQYAGIIALIAVSLIGSVVGSFIDSRYVGLLGLFPIYLGIRQLIQLLKRQMQDDSAPVEKNNAAGVLTVATVTFANGGDNIGTYIPLFTSLTPSEKLLMLIIFLAMTSIWLTTAKYLTKHPMMAKTISKYGHIITPIVLCLLGLYILKENGSFELFK
jgi:cadmium resistance transport/sequestration family protein